MRPLPGASSERRESHEERQQRAVTLASLRVGIHAELGDRAVWPDSRLNLWCNRHPLLLLAALPMVPLLEGYPRPKGPPSEADLDALAHWHVVMEAASDLALWTGLYTWGLDRLFVEYARRHDGLCHPCLDRTLWVGAHIGRPYLPALDWTAFWMRHQRRAALWAAAPLSGTAVLPLHTSTPRRAAA